MFSKMSGNCIYNMVEMRFKLCWSELLCGSVAVYSVSVEFVGSECANCEPDSITL